VAERGNSNAVSDAGVAALLAEAGCVGASYNVRINVASLGDKARGERLAIECRELVERTRDLARRTAAIVERSLGA
jgi:formiminotetrahydrofolate cyclodeaminase